MNEGIDFQRVNPKTGEDTGDPVAMNDVYSEFNDKISEKHKIMKFKCMVRFYQRETWYV